MTSFPTTHWSFVTQLRESSGQARERLVESFLTRYFPPMWTYLQGRFPRINACDREDLMQDFVTDRFIQRSVLDEARKNRGQLRFFLQACLTNFARTWLRRGAPGLDFENIELDQCADENERQHQCRFDLAWARYVVGQGVIRLKDECYRSDKPLMWSVFDFRLLRPMTLGVEPVAYETLSVRLGVGEKQLANLLTTSKRKLKLHLLEIVGDYTGSSADTDLEVQDLFRVMSTS
ncbi:MAG: hypothetical protein V3V20_08055 [Algisphaera sp.]